MFSYPLLALVHRQSKPHPRCFSGKVCFCFSRLAKVYLGGHDGALAEQGLDVFDIHVIIQEQRGEGRAV